jgi:hypothetical protein
MCIPVSLPQSRPMEGQFYRGLLTDMCIPASHYLRVCPQLFSEDRRGVGGGTSFDHSQEGAGKDSRRGTGGETEQAGGRGETWASGTDGRIHWDRCKCCVVLWQVKG